MKLFYLIFRLVAKSISLLPFRLIYIFSDLLAFCLGSVFRYRKKVVVSNLKKSFPEKSNEEIRKLTKGFYRNLADITFEIIKLETITKKELFCRVSVEGENIFSKIYENKQGVVVVMSHTANWEWISQRVCFEGKVFDDVGVIAKEMSNPYFEGYFTNIRMQLQHGIAEIIPFTETAKYLALTRHKRSMIIAIADQSPHINQIKFRMPFLNQDTGIFLGPERIARSLNYALVFCHVQRTGRGYYKISFELLSETPKETADYDITRAHVKMLEDDIIKSPEAWLWSHRRWKY
jgi:Kdo2-lipid IVA lauroyltransferase/acyltransferase